MRSGIAFVLLALLASSAAADLPKLPANTWVELKYTTEQPVDPAEKGKFARQGWNKIVFDPDGQRVLFYDRWVDKKHGGWTIYGNCLFGFDPARAILTPIKIDHLTKLEPKGGGYRTPALPENDDEPTPCSRHVYHAFDYAPDLKAVFLCNGANQTALDRNGKLVGHDLCDGAWRFDVGAKRWTRLASKMFPPNHLDDAMAYCPDIRSLVYAGTGRQLWLFDLATGEWRKSKHSPPARPSSGQTTFYDPSQRRMLILGGGPLDAWQKGKAEVFRELYAFDPKTEEVRRLADGPTAFYESHLVYEPKHQLFLTVAVFNKKEQPSGMFCYDPKHDAWTEVKSANPIPPHKSWHGWMQLCYDSVHECFIAKVDEQFYAYRFVPAAVDKQP